jgi:folate-binding protein YgfZ
VSAPLSPGVFVLDRNAVMPSAAGAVLRGTLVAAPEVALLDVTGPGAVACLQGLLTNDVVAPGEGSFVYGAVLTPKGMIVSDLWAARDGGEVRLTVPAAGLAPLLEIFRRSLPPRLARVADRSGELAALRLVGPLALDVARRAGLSVPPEGRWADAVARPQPGAPFAAQLIAPRDDVPSLMARLTAAGAVPGDSPDLELARVLAGWPRLGAEIDDKTLPQEARYDEIGGVSYTKGCYTGQETVARIHFRGHPNRVLRGLTWRGEPDAASADLEQEGRPRGRVSSMVWLPSGRVVGMGVVRREVEPGSTVRAAGAEAQVAPLPFDPSDWLR